MFIKRIVDNTAIAQHEQLFHLWYSLLNRSYIFPKSGVLLNVFGTSRKSNLSLKTRPLPDEMNAGKGLKFCIIDGRMFRVEEVTHYRAALVHFLSREPDNGTGRPIPYDGLN